MFGDNEYAVNSLMYIYTKFRQPHNIIYFHRARESVAADICHFRFIPGKNNPADILSKQWEYNDVWSLLRPIMLWYGNTANIPESNTITNKLTGEW